MLLSHEKDRINMNEDKYEQILHVFLGRCMNNLYHAVKAYFKDFHIKVAP
jgi:hypothetical protein